MKVEKVKAYSRKNPNNGGMNMNRVWIFHFFVVQSARCKAPSGFCFCGYCGSRGVSSKDVLHVQERTKKV